MNIRSEHASRGISLEPHAIINRPINYLSLNLIETHDHFDSFKLACFSIGNAHYFEARQYSGHPCNTFTIYLDSKIEDEAEIRRLINEYTLSLMIPLTAIGWVRGDDFVYGELNRNLEDRLLEREASVAILKLIYMHEDELCMRGIRNSFLQFYDPSLKDLERSYRGWPLWNQVVRNVISNRSKKTSIFNKGFARYDRKRVEITRAGEEYLEALGFK